MKKTLLTLSSFTTLLSFGQINITAADLPSIGTQYININDVNLQGINVGNAGTDQIYDFTGFANTSEDTIIYLDPAQTIYASSFTNANLALYNSGDSSLAFLAKTTSDISIVGMLMPVPIGTSGTAVVTASDPVKQFVTPTTYLTTFTDQGALASAAIPFYQEISASPLTYFDSVRANITYDRLSLVDGWGTLNTPFGTSFSVLRQVVTDIRTITPEFNMITEFNGFPVPLGYQTIPGTEITDTTVTYYYLTNVAGETPMILAEIQQNGLGSILSAKYAKLPFAGIKEMDNNAEVILFPNPSKNEFTISSKEEMNLIEIYSYEGKKVSEITPKSKEKQISVSNLIAGNYLVKIHTKSGITTRKIVKQ